jgi:hypothetical protein
MNEREKENRETVAVGPNTAYETQIILAFYDRPGIHSALNQGSPSVRQLGSLTHRS